MREQITVRNMLNEILSKTFESCITVTSESNATRRLMSPELLEAPAELKKFPKNTGDVFVIGWQIRAGKKLKAFMIQNGKVTAYKYDVTVYEYTRLHTHDYLELGYVVSGEFSQVIQGKSTHFKSGEFCLIDTNCIHKDVLQGDATVLFFGLSNRLFDAVLDSKDANNTLEEFLQNALVSQKRLNQYLHLKPLLDNKDAIESVLEFLIREMQDNTDGTEYIKFGLLYRLLKLLCTDYDFTLTKEQVKRRKVLVGDEVIRYINLNFADISVNDLSNKFNYNEDYFNRLLKEREGMTYSAYLQKVRLDNAVKLLCDTDKSIEEIVSMCGYINRGYFYKIFREKYGETPSRYRSRNRIQKT